jgi:hypothetical protein
MTHFLDEQGNIPKQMPKEARELASFFALVIDTTTNINPKRLSATNIRCSEKGCPGAQGLKYYTPMMKSIRCVLDAKIKEK